jgi:hypothetical protein
MRRLALALVLLAAAAGAARAQGVVSSARPDRVAVTVYRDPQRSPAQAPDLDLLNGYALVSETRQISLPAGESQIRFEGVAGGMIPQSAIVTGLPEGVIERNRDAYLLSPATLLDRSLGRRVHLRRTMLATGAVREQEAVVRSSADGALVLQTADGFEALRCTGLAETPVYDEVPEGLSPRPTLSVRARSAAPLTATVTLSYLATGFDWQANYIAALAPDGERLDLFAWLTLASNDETSFVDADTQAVAGQINREPVEPQPREGGPLQLRCWPQQRTSDIPYQDWQRGPPPPPAPMVSDDAEAIVVTGTVMRSANLSASTPVTAIMAVQEELGDLKLYRIPEPVTVAANSQKQVALLQRENVEMSLVYRQRVTLREEEDQESVGRVIVTRNREAEGLGLPLPAGRVALFAGEGERPLLLGEGVMADHAIGDDVEIYFGSAAGVIGRVERDDRRGGDAFALVVTNDQPRPIRFEAEFVDVQDVASPSRRLERRDGQPLWSVTVPANGTARLSFRLRPERRPS